MHCWPTHSQKMHFLGLFYLCTHHFWPHHKSDYTSKLSPITELHDDINSVSQHTVLAHPLLRKHSPGVDLEV